MLERTRPFEIGLTLAMKEFRAVFLAGSAPTDVPHASDKTNCLELIKCRTAFTAPKGMENEPEINDALAAAHYNLCWFAGVAQFNFWRPK